MKRGWTFVLAFVLGGAACGGGDPGSGPDAAAPTADAYGAGPPIEAPDSTWTFIPFPESRCMNDTPTGIGVNLNPSSKKLLIYLEGGGACFNQATCFGVAHQNGFDEAEFQNVMGQYGSAGLFNRNDDDNPFKDWSYVFIPYCSGDIHAGNADQGFGGRVQVGYRNMGHYLERISPTFPDVTEVVLAGSSAGGFGAAYNFDRVQQVFGHRPVTLLDDSGPPMADEFLAPCLQAQIRGIWNLNDTLPPDCAECRAGDGGLVNIATYLAEKYPENRFGLVTSTRDGVIRLFYGYGYPSCSNPTVPMPEAPFEMGISDLVDNVLAPYDNFKAYVIDSGLHVWLLETPLGTVTSGGVTLTDWIRGLLDGGQDFRTVKP